MKKLVKCVVGLLGLTLICHICEWFIIGKKIADKADIPVAKALPLCLACGFLWWKPIKRGIK